MALSSIHVLLVRVWIRVVVLTALLLRQRQGLFVEAKRTVRSRNSAASAASASWLQPAPSSAHGPPLGRADCTLRLGGGAGRLPLPPGSPDASSAVASSSPAAAASVVGHVTCVQKW